ncbi:hypothetical protein GGR39_000533 [Novosphingobium fluoreni]|uniref:Uncharacterized protein n=1 Tax=Novosphingobium fluoreni TaxID=1391222 RepID=A0A7W6BZF9_9SPHN|nr:hypothetical protein [Novosphingobium fluoreni]
MASQCVALTALYLRFAPAESPDRRLVGMAVTIA